MPGRYALIAASPHAEDATTLAGILGDPARGGFTVERAHDSDSVARFLAARTPTDVVLVHTDGVAVDPGALTACRSTHVLVLATDRHADVHARPGSAVIAGASTQAVVRALRDGRADGNADGDVTARELHNRLAHTLTLRFIDELETPFVVSYTQRHARALRRERRRNRREDRQALHAKALRVAAGAGGVALLASLPMPWLFGEIGLDYAFAGGTAWPSRVAPLLCLVAALAALFSAATSRGDDWAGALASAGGGAIYGLLDRFAEPAVGVGVWLAFLALMLVLLGALRAIVAYPGQVGVACGAAAVLGYQVVAPRDWLWIVIAAAVFVVCFFAARD